MALGKLLLLCLVASEVWCVETKPTFVCNRGARRAFNIVEEVKSELSSCHSSASLSTPVRLPCVELHVASWENKSHQEKRGDIVASFELLIEGLEFARARSQPGCATSLLQRLENNINNYLLILRNLHLNQGSVVSPALSCVPLSTHSLCTVLLHYDQLISGKLEHFILNLEDSC